MKQVGGECSVEDLTRGKHFRGKPLHVRRLSSSSVAFCPCGEGSGGVEGQGPGRGWTPMRMTSVGFSECSGYVSDSTSQAGKAEKAVTEELG